VSGALRQFRTSEVAQLARELGGLGHVENPFLDPRYSLDGYYPVTDFTTVVAQWITERRWQAIGELWTYLTSDGPAERAMLRMAMVASVLPELGFDEDTAAEIKAVHVLGSRLAMYEFGRDAVPFAIGRVLATRLASIEWAPSHEVASHLRRGAEVEALTTELDPPGHRRTLAERAMNALLAPQDDSDRNLGAWMLRLPPMARLVIADYFERGDGRLRPELYYGDRKYGCRAEINLRFVEWTGSFAVPPEDADLPHALTKEHLRETLHARGVTVKKSATRDAMIAVARTHGGAISSIYKTTLRLHRVASPEWEPSLRRWAERCRDLRPIALAVLKSLALQSSRYRPAAPRGDARTELHTAIEERLAHLPAELRNDILRGL